MGAAAPLTPAATCRALHLAVDQRFASGFRVAAALDIELSPGGRGGLARM